MDNDALFLDSPFTMEGTVLPDLGTPPHPLFSVPFQQHPSFTLYT